MVNFNDLLKSADDAGFSAVPPDEYDVEVVKAEAKVSSTSQRNMIVVQLKILAGPHAGKSVFNNFVITTDNPNALGFFFRNMAALGLERTYFESNPPLAQVAAALVGRKATVKVSVREWNGSERNQVDSIKKLAGVGGATPFIPGVVVPQQMATTPPLPPAPVMGTVAPPAAPPAVTDPVPAAEPPVVPF